MKSKRWFSLGFLLLVTALSLALPAHADTADQSQAQAMIQVALNAQAVAQRLLAMRQAQGVGTADAAAQISDGNTLLQEAQAAYTSGDYATAIAMATQAQAKFRDAILASEFEGSTTQAGNFQERIERARSLLARLESILTSVPATSSSSAELAGLLSDANSALNNAENAVNSNQAANAETFLAQAESDLQRALADVSQLALVSDATRGEAEIEALESKVAVLQTQIDQAAMKGIRVDDLRAQVSQVQSLIDDARQKFATSDTANAVSDIQQAQQLMVAIQQALASRQT